VGASICYLSSSPIRPEYCYTPVQELKKRR
jgi:hypothetical protein